MSSQGQKGKSLRAVKRTEKRQAKSMKRCDIIVSIMMKCKEGWS